MNIELEFPSNEDLVDIYAEFNATRESVKNDVSYLMEWLEKQPHLPNIKDEEFLANFLIRCKNSLEKCKRRLHLYYVCKSTLPQLYANRVESKEELLECWKIVEIIPLPKLTPEKRRVVIHTFSPLNGTAAVKAECVVKLYTTLWDIGLKSDTSRGYIIVYDFANLNATFAATILTTWKLALSIFMKGAPIRIHKLYVLNLSPAFQTMMQFGMTLAPKKLTDRIVIWSKSSTNLAEELPRNILPSNYGGDESSVAELKEIILKYFANYFEWLQSSDINDKADLSKMPRCSYSNNTDSSFGLNGSFRKISFD